MKALEYLYRMKKANDEMGMAAMNLNEAIEELEGLKSCDGCKYHYDTMGDCAKDYMCARGFVDYYEPKDKQCQ